jgi:hypothetical protein
MPRWLSVRSCRVTIQNLDGISHTAEVTADTLYEAVAQDPAAFRENEWVQGVQEQFGVVNCIFARPKSRTFTNPRVVKTAVMDR